MKYKYYKTKYKRWSASDVFVYIEEPWNDYSGEMTCYCPIGQHGECSVDYVKNDCKEIKKEQYIKVSEGLYTPKEYLK